MRYLSVLFVASLLLVVRLAWAEVPVTDCDRMAADPIDADKVTEGVNWQDLVSHRAIKACQNAVIKWPTSIRLKYQLARALMKGENYSESVSLLVELSSEAGH